MFKNDDFIWKFEIGSILLFGKSKKFSNLDLDQILPLFLK